MPKSLFSDTKRSKKCKIWLLALYRSMPNRDPDIYKISKIKKCMVSAMIEYYDTWNVYSSAHPKHTQLNEKIKEFHREHVIWDGSGRMKIFHRGS